MQPKNYHYNLLILLSITLLLSGCLIQTDLQSGRGFIPGSTSPNPIHSADCPIKINPETERGFAPNDTTTDNTRYKNSIDMTFVLIPAGKFMMGSGPNESGESDEQPRHEVVIAPFYMSQYEVTQEQWIKLIGHNPAEFKGEMVKGDSKKHPVESISWEDAHKFIERLNALEKTDQYRLPTEAEWEYAARAGSQTVYYFGDNENQLKNHAWYVNNSNEQTHPVGKKQPNAFGLYDMHGNVWEWCQDVWHDNYDSAPPSGRAWLTGKNPTRRVFRGGAWSSRATRVRSANRDWMEAMTRDPNIGLRLVITCGT